jgi:sugar lactone lactonase YvrE
MNRQQVCNSPLTRACDGIGWLAAIFIGGIDLAAAEELFVSKQLTPTNEYTRGIEGPAVNAAGDLFVTNIRRPGTPNPDKKGAIGRMKKGATQSTEFAVLPKDGIGNGIRFDLQGRMYVADFPRHVVHVFEAGATTPQPYFSAPPTNDGKPAFNQPNDLAIARDGTLYASDPDFNAGTGRIWRITRQPDGKGAGAIMTSSSSRPQGITNGVDLSPDNKTLYVSESRFNGENRPAKIWSYRIDGMTLADETEVAKFDQGDVDGLRVDTDGRIFVARPDAGQVVIVVPPGALGVAPPPVKTKGPAPTNLTFGGADGRDVFVTQSNKPKRFIERFRTDRPGREPCLQTPAPADCRAIGQ